MTTYSFSRQDVSAFLLDADPTLVTIRSHSPDLSPFVRVDDDRDRSFSLHAVQQSEFFSKPPASVFSALEPASAVPTDDAVASWITVTAHHIYSPEPLFTPALVRSSHSSPPAVVSCSPLGADYIPTGVQLDSSVWQSTQQENEGAAQDGSTAKSEYSDSTVRTPPLYVYSYPVNPDDLTALLQPIYDGQQHGVQPKRDSNDWICYSPHARTDTNTATTSATSYNSRYSQPSSSAKRKRDDDGQDDKVAAQISGSAYTNSTFTSPLRQFKPAKRSRTSQTASQVHYQASETASSRKAKSLSAEASWVGNDASGTSVSCAQKRAVHPRLMRGVVYENSSHQIQALEDFLPTSSPIEVAQKRIDRILEREVGYRLQDGLSDGACQPFPSDDKSVSEMLGLPLDRRADAIEWLMDVVAEKRPGSELAHHLEHQSNDLRFHAITLFSRYFLRRADVELHERNVPLYIQISQDRFMWDIALGCLAISVKFDHDFLYPYTPIPTRHFRDIGQIRPSHDDFETVQRNVLAMFDHEIFGISPYALMEEMWIAAPCLHRFLEFHSAWMMVKKHAWEYINASTLEHDFHRFPTSLLTVASVLEGTDFVLRKEYTRQAKRVVSSSSSVSSTATVRRQPVNPLSVPARQSLLRTATQPQQLSNDELQRVNRKVLQHLKLISSDLCKVFRFNKVDVNTCREWIVSHWT